MKKLLLLAFLNCGIFANSQQLSTENFNGLTIGNVGTNINGTTLGQGGWITFTTATAVPVGVNSDYQIIDSGAPYANTLQITGGSGAVGQRTMLKSGFPAVWAARTSGNDILEVEFDFFTGAATASRNSFSVYVVSDETTPKIIAGIDIAKNATTSLGSFVNNIRGISYINDPVAGLGSYLLGLAPTTPFQVTTTNATWLRLGVSYNKTTGKVTWKGPGIDSFSNGLAAGLNIGSVRIVANTGASTAVPNAAAASALFDNLSIKATATDSLLSIINNELQSDVFAVLPNPASSLIKIFNSENIVVNEISITDLNGRAVKTATFKNVSDIEMNIADLTAGMYLLNIKSDNGVATKKIIKN